MHTNHFIGQSQWTSDWVYVNPSACFLFIYLRDALPLWTDRLIWINSTLFSACWFFPLARILHTHSTSVLWIFWGSILTLDWMPKSTFCFSHDLTASLSLDYYSLISFLFFSLSCLWQWEHKSVMYSDRESCMKKKRNEKWGLVSSMLGEYKCQISESPCTWSVLCKHQQKETFTSVTSPVCGFILH